MPPRLLLIEDDAGVRRGLQLLLEGHGYAVQSFASARPAIADPASVRATHVVIDYALPDDTGVAALGALRARGWRGIAVLITGHGSALLDRGARAAGFAAVIAKPFRDDQLLAALAAPASPAPAR